MSHAAIDWRLVAGVAALIVAAAIVFLYQYFRKQPDPEQEERQRRVRVNQIGRIVAGQVTELVEVPAAAPVPTGLSFFPRRRAAISDGAARAVRCMIWYSYSISGVTYETAQDITGLEQRVSLKRLAAGQSASVKYDPSNPSNSILVSEDWSGLH